MNPRDASLVLLEPSLAAGRQSSPVTGADDVGFTEFYLHSTRQPAIYINLFFAFLLVLIVPVRSMIFGLPTFPGLWAALLEWGVMVPACLGTAWLRSSERPARLVARWTSLLIALNFSSLVIDIVVWQRSGVPIPHEYSALCFVGFLSVGGLPGRTVAALCLLFLGLNVAVFQYFDAWTPAAVFKLYFDVVGICVAFLIAMMLRHEASVAWALKTRLNAMAFRDPLTGLANRHYLEERVGDIFLQAQREQKRIGLALVDLDRFKGLNDTHGHLAGDAALQRVGQELQRYTESRHDIAARIGGDEFLLIWLDITPRRGEELCRQLLRAIAAAGIRNGAAESGRLGVSVGAVVGIPATSQDFERFRRCADEELYRVKSARGSESLQLAEI